tara:strand:- start:2143 stop:2592 length:450 start_codon:yes stop_codon:yes gene_type:complete
MASLFNNYAKEKLAEAEIDLDADTIKIALLTTDTTADTEANAQTLSGFTTLGEFSTSGTNYARATLANVDSRVDTGNNRYEFDADNVTFTSLAASSPAKDIQGCLLLKHVDGTDANDLPIAFIDFASDLTPDGSNVTITWDEQGILQLS